MFKNMASRPSTTPVGPARTEEGWIKDHAKDSGSRSGLSTAENLTKEDIIEKPYRLLSCNYELENVSGAAWTEVMRVFAAIQLGANKLANTWNRRMLSNGNLGPFIIGVAGGTASGKTTVCKNIMSELGQAHINEKERKVVCIAQDSFYRNLTPAEKRRASEGRFNFDHPGALDFDLMLATMTDLVQGREAKVPVYDFLTNSRKDEFTVVHPADVILVEGILIFYDDTMRSLFDLKVFVDSDADVRLSRRVLRDVTERGRELETVLTQYTETVKPAFEEFCMPTKKHADVIIPRGPENTVGINLIIQHIQDVLKNNENSNAAEAGVNGGGYGGNNMNGGAGTNHVNGGNRANHVNGGDRANHVNGEANNVNGHNGIQNGHTPRAEQNGNGVRRGLQQERPYYVMSRNIPFPGGSTPH